RRDRLIARAQPLAVARTRASAFALLHRMVADEDERDQRARKLDQRAAEIGDAQPAMRRGGLLRYFGSLSGSPTYHAAAPPRRAAGRARVGSGGALGDKAHRVNVSGRVMPAFICETCGSQFTPSDAPPPSCPICEDERQFVPPGGQRWTTLEALARRHFN